LIDRVKRGSVLVPNWSACILGSIQPAVAHKEFGGLVDDGLIQRFDVHYGHLIGNGEDRIRDYQADEAYHDLFKKLASPGDAILGKKGGIIKFSTEAQQIRIFTRDTIKHVINLPTTSNSLRAALEKWESRFARYCLTFHIIEAVSAGQQPPPLISTDTAKRVSRLMIDFLLPNAFRFYNELLPESRNLIDARWIAGHILAKKLEQVTERDLYRANRAYRFSPDLVQNAMKILCSSSWLKPTKWKKDGRAVRWSVNPLCHRMFSARAEQERQTRDETIRKIQEAVAFFSPSVNPEEEKMHESL